MKKILFYISLSFLIFSMACNESHKNPFDTSKTLDLNTGNFSLQDIELIISNNNSTVLNGCLLVSVEMRKNGQKVGFVKKLVSGPWQPKQTQKVNLNWDYFKSDNSQSSAGNYTFSINSEVPEHCD